MARKKAPAGAGGNTLMLQAEKGESKEQQLAKVKLSSVVLNTLTASAFVKSSMGEVDLTTAIDVVKEKANKITAGDISGLEATLAAQVVSLDAIFNEMARRAALNMGAHLQATESYMRLALKAQAQTARTIEVLAAIKNPPVVFAKQANIAHGHQQVNNGGQAPAHTGKTINQSNELLEVQHGGETMDGTATQTAIPENPAMAAVD